MDEDLIRRNLEIVRSRVDDRCRANGTNPSGVTIVGVTKFVPAEIAGMAVKAGLNDLGENRVQEAAGKIKEVHPRPKWHLIGHLQKNKVKKAVEIFDVIESVDCLKLAELISEKALGSGRRMEIHIELNSSNEPTKHGFGPEDIAGFADKINELSGVRLTGLMTVGPLTDDENLIRGSFELTRRIFESLREAIGIGFRVLSMGMSGDYEIALDFGANELRIGTAIFGPRPAEE